MKNKSYKLSNGLTIPALGFGTFLIKEGEEVINAVATALETGYRHIDTAAAYQNEKGVGEGIRKSGVPREEIFLVSKVWNSEQGYDKTKKAFQDTLDRLKTDYLDLYLIHWPKPLSGETWKAMEELYQEGKIKSIGVCNFTQGQMDDLLKTATITPMVNQVELHPQFPQYDLQRYNKDKGILIESWGPLMQGKIFQVELAGKIAAKYGITVAQLAILWQFQQNNIALVKSSHPERIKENFQVPDITLSQEDLKALEAMEGERIGADPLNFNF